MSAFRIIDENNNFVTIVDDEGTYRLAVDAEIVGGSFQLQPFIPKTFFNSAGIELNATSWTTLLSVTDTSGKLDFIAMAGSSSQYRVRVTVDGVILYNIKMADLSSIGLSNATNVPIWAETADKNFRHHPTIPVDFISSILVEAMAISATPSVFPLISYRLGA